MRRLAIVVAGFVTCALAPPEAPSSPTAFSDFDEALASYDFNRAGEIIDSLIQQRTPADGKPKPDPLLNALIGRMLLSGQHEEAALPYLEGAPIDQLPPSLQASTALAHARTLELMGYRERALTGYQAAGNVGAGPERRKATMGLARQLLVTDPHVARQMLASVSASSDPSERWEVSYLLAAASSLLGDRASASQLSDRAWSDAGRAPASALAPLRVSVLRAGLAAATGDRATELSMLAAANSMAVTRGSDLVSQLPVCGDEGVQPTDFVIFGAFAGPYNGGGLIPIAASRPAVVRPFYDRLTGRQVLKPDTVSSASGTVFTASCFSKVDAGYVSDRLPTDPLADWYVAKGIYPATVRGDASDEGINRISDRMDLLENRFGHSSILLVPARWQLLTQLEARARAGDDVSPGRLVELRTALAEGLRSGGADSWLADTVEIRTEMDRLARRVVEGQGDVKDVQALWSRLISVMPFRYARLIVAEGLEQFGEQMEGPQATLVTDLNARMPASYEGRERQAWLVNVARAQKALGHDQQARSTIASMKLPADICSASDEPPVMIEQNFTAEDYPRPLIPAELTGYANYEFSITEAGTAASPRPVLTFPSGLFDEASLKGLASMRFTPAKQNGKARRCQGFSQGITWRLEDEDNSLPSIMPQSSGERT